jgi:2-haloacid dehalogenase
MDYAHVQYVIFDTFGTVTDWRSCVVEEVKLIGKKYGFDIDWELFVSAWRGEGYIKVTQAIARGELPWEGVDDMHMKKLLELAQTYQLPNISKEDLHSLNQVWHRLRPWPDAVEGLTRLKKKFRIGPFSNGDFKLLLDMAKNAGLPWDFITSADIFKRYKPDPLIYSEEVRFLGVRPDEVVFVSAHPTDRAGAKVAGCITALVPRPLEYGDGPRYLNPVGKQPKDIEARDFLQLAQILGA